MQKYKYLWVESVLDPVIVIIVENHRRKQIIYTIFMLAANIIRSCFGTVSV